MSMSNEDRMKRAAQFKDRTKVLGRIKAPLPTDGEMKDGYAEREVVLGKDTSVDGARLHFDDATNCLYLVRTAPDALVAVPKETWDEMGEP